MGVYLYSTEGVFFTILTTLFQIVKIALPILAVVFLIKGINYIKCKEAREDREDYYNAQRTLDEIEQELNNRQD